MTPRKHLYTATRDAWVRAFRVVPRLPPDQWADKYRVLPQTDNVPGPLRSIRTPYAIGPQRAIHSRDFPRVFFVAPSQVAKSTIAYNTIGSETHQASSPCIYISPTRDLNIDVIHPKIDAMLRNSAELWGLTEHGRDYAKLRKVVNGASIRLAHAGSDTQLAAESSKIVVVDEIDRCSASMTGEGTVVGRADARHATYDDGITIGISSPTLGNVESYRHALSGLTHWQISKPEQLISYTWRYWQSGTRHEWSTPCPECREYFIPRGERLIYPRDATPEEASAAVTCACEHCGASIDPGWRDWMNSRGIYVMPGQRPLPCTDDARPEHAHIVDCTTEPYVQLPHDDPRVTTIPIHTYHVSADVASSGIDGTFWLSGLMTFSKKRDWRALAAAVVRAQQTGDEDEVIPVTNTWLGECHAFSGDVPDWEQVQAISLHTDYQSGDLPDGFDPMVLFATVDVQHDRFEWLVRAWGWRDEGLTSAMVERGTVWGSPESEAAQAELRIVLTSRYAGYALGASAIDSGALSHVAYGLARAVKGMMPVKGYKMLASGQPYKASAIDVDSSGRRKSTAKKNTLNLWSIGVDATKAWVHSQIRKTDPAYIRHYLPRDVSEQYCREIVNEVRVRRNGAYDWVVRGPNESLDLESYQRFLSLRFASTIKSRHARGDGPRRTGEATQALDASAAPAKRRQPRKRATYSVSDW